MRFYFENEEFEIVNHYKYLGIIFSRSSAFADAKKQIAEQGKKLYSHF